MTIIERAREVFRVFVAPLIPDDQPMTVSTHVIQGIADALVAERARAVDKARSTVSYLWGAYIGDRIAEAIEKEGA